ncbi:sensor histidine kinase [Pectinatus frisingensis]|uniref:sensor histidine kinase n=1 Tax=Pectinatus frisingensis TaxID=865 RepID=UPI002EDA128E
MINAIRYSPENSKVIVSSETERQKDERWLIIHVIDNGFGIAADDIEHIFESFYRSEKSRDRKRGGSGLGLAIVKQLVEIHDGKVQVKSIQGKGSEFIVSLPIKDICCYI